ncbi:unnamed protein product [Protopolystoma xenopodis]|uniref:Uncharacterized protein n=1 Tax=Protopolystoma xenopodis TaxID=117903 RepID=A0A448XPN3_9PLAT|nr:unnamed protein product [Protopolystoma xenopodis]
MSRGLRRQNGCCTTRISQRLPFRRADGAFWEVRPTGMQRHCGRPSTLSLLPQLTRLRLFLIPTRAGSRAPAQCYTATIADASASRRARPFAVSHFNGGLTVETSLNMLLTFTADFLLATRLVNLFRRPTDQLHSLSDCGQCQGRAREQIQMRKRLAATSAHRPYYRGASP